MSPVDTGIPPFHGLEPGPLASTPLRLAIDRATRIPEARAVHDLLAFHPEDAGREQALALASKLVLAQREKQSQAHGAAALMHEFSLSSEEGVALMCLAEALLRIPDAATRDRLIADKLSQGNWREHVGHSPSLFVNAAAWGLLLSGKLLSTHSEAGLSALLARALERGGQPLLRGAVDYAMRLLGRQFVCGQTIDEALRASRDGRARGYRYSYDMLGEAAMTEEDAQRYLAAYEEAILAVGDGAGDDPRAGPGISIKLSALHPRYSRAQRERVMQELLPRLRRLALLAKRHSVGINIDAEESERLTLSLDLLAALAHDPALSGYGGLGFVVQAYQKRCPYVIDWLADLARETGTRFMLRLVKGAYWDSEIKRAQVEGLADYPVFTRKAHTDLSWLVCARKLLQQGELFYPQFATHNALSLATVHNWAIELGVDDFEFQCLHGMGEPLYDEVVGERGLGRRCRIYAPVGPHETLLAYLVRRLLENGANTSFVNRVVDPSTPVDQLLADPFRLARESNGASHPAIALPPQLYADERRNSEGLDLANDSELARLQQGLAPFANQRWQVGHTGAAGGDEDRAQPALVQIRSPANQADIVAQLLPASAATVDAGAQAARAAQPHWHSLGPSGRAACLIKAADLMQQHMPELSALICREAGRSLQAAVNEVREAIDFLRYYASQAQYLGKRRPLGTVACISPWNFPLAIFTGQASAALAAGNAVLAKPAEQTSATAMRAVTLLHEAGVPRDCLQLMPGKGSVLGAALAGHALVDAVMFTGSTEVGTRLQATLLQRAAQEGRALPLIAETGGLNAMLVDSSALPEQVVQDVLSSAFDSAGQRCSALRLLCLQQEIADKVLHMLRGALQEWRVGLPGWLNSDSGPVIGMKEVTTLKAHLEQMRGRGFPVWQAALPQDLPAGSWFAPALIEVGAAGDVQREVFGPILHVLRYRRQDLPGLLDAIAASGYGLTMGLHTRVDETIAQVLGRAKVGNLYVNRNMIGAVVGVQPFGGMGKSGTGPKAGGPHYLQRLVQDAPDDTSGDDMDLPGPTGESNRLRLVPRGRVLCLAQQRELLQKLLAHAQASGNHACLLAGHTLGLDAPVIDTLAGPPVLALVLADQSWLARLAQTDFPDGAPLVLPVIDEVLPPHWMMLAEQTVTINTAAVGGNASLMTLGT